jgi:hypothetical protein
MFKNVVSLLTLMAVAGFFASCSLDEPTSANSVQETNSTTEFDAQILKEQAADESVASMSKKSFVHAIIVNIDGEDYYLAGAPDGPDGATDIPGHYWTMAGQKQLVGKHYNEGPFGASQWWSSDAPDGELLYIVHGIIDTWSVEKAEKYAARGYVHYHEFLRVSDGVLHPTKVVWLRHTARTSFNLDGGPHPELAHEVSPGIDSDFIPNGMMPYSP